jgi:hypothetical protein
VASDGGLGSCSGPGKDLLSFPEVQMRCPGLMVENWMAYAYIHNSDNLNSKAVFIGSVV